ncbi:hypothetical protein FAZ95_31555 [Trinickia violacea]|uniref:Uncharacterized protein n=1 Tax=Trinickia violacea TaxID=2571746 RepID=A0A4P8J201_9BURK|nr:hypothetical protein FAZ95_31555 [Trinickia violacea]
MKHDGHSLRTQIEKWFGATQAASVHVSRAPRALPGASRCVSVSRPLCPYVIVFFQHRDGSWCVYPPPANQPTLNVFRRAA